jgi:hypothetical protein
VSESADIKLSEKSTVKVDGDGESQTASVEFQQNSNFSWGGATTNKSTSSTGTGIAVNTSSGATEQGYPFYPTFYMATDGMLKVAHAVDPLGGSDAQTSFWAGIYGAKPDPALNLPYRFTRTYSPTNELNGWEPNTAISAKQIRGFFLTYPDQNTITQDYAMLGETPIRPGKFQTEYTGGDQFRILARVYNYSTAQSFANLKVRFQVVEVNPATYLEIDPTTGQESNAPLDPSKRTTIGDATLT